MWRHSYDEQDRANPDCDFLRPYVMTIYQPQPPPEPGPRRHQTALWAGAAAFFGSLLAIGAFDVLNPDAWVEYLGAIFVAGITAGAVYSKQRLDDAKREEHRGDATPPQ
jgi:hypothetical protein